MKNYHAHRPFIRGISLVETMVTLSIMAILLTMAMPSYKSSIDSNRRTTYANQLVEDLNLARSEAIKRNTTVTVCPSTAPNTCIVGSHDWTRGWLVFVDPNNNARVDGGETVLRVHEALVLPAGWSANQNLGTSATLRPTGEFDGLGAAGFRICIMQNQDNCSANGLLAEPQYTNIVVKAPARIRIETETK